MTASYQARELTLPRPAFNLPGMRFSRLLYGLLALAVAIWWVSQLGGEEKRIRGRLDELADLLGKDGPENALVAANKARSVALLFARDFEVLLQGYGSGAVSGPQQISQAMLRYRTPPSSIEVTFRDVEIELDAGERTAGMSAVAVAAATTGGNFHQRRFRLAFRWVKEEEEWVIRRAELIEELDAGLF